MDKKRAAPHTSSAARRKAHFTTAVQVAGIAALYVLTFAGLLAFMLLIIEVVRRAGL